MIAPRTSTEARVTYLLLAALLALASISSMAWAGTAPEPGPAVSVTDLERLAQQIEDPEQRAQLLKTLQALIVAARQGRAGVPAQEKSGLFADRSPGLFFAFGELTQHLATVSRRLGRSLTALPVLLGELPAHLRDPAMIGFAVHLVLSLLILVACGIVLQLIADRMEKKLRARALASDTIPSWRKIWLAMITIGLAVTPYAGLLVVSGIVFSIFPLGAVPSGLAALLIVTYMLYRLIRAVARVALNPDGPRARLLPLRDSTAQQSWNWAVRFSILAALYFLITRTLLTIGVSHEWYQVVRGVMLLVWATVLSALVARLAQVQRATAATPPGADRRRRWSGVMTTLQRVWPTLAIAYIWCVTLLALFSFRRGVGFIAAASLQMTVVIGASMVLLWAGEHLFNKAATLTDQVGRYMPGLEVRTIRYLRTVWWGFRVLIIVAAILLSLQVWGVGIAWLFTSPVGSDLLSRLITLLVTVAIVLFIIDLSAFLSQKFIEPTRGGAEASKKRKTLVPLTATVIKYATLFAGGLVILHLMGVNITPILAGAGILSLAVGFGAQTLVKDIINGLFILVEDSLSVGDVVNVRGIGGAVEAVNLRTIRLRDEQGSVHTIPNSQVEIITNMTKDYAYYVLNVAVAYREDTDEVIAALQEVDIGMRTDPAFATDMLAPIEILGVDSFSDSAIMVKARLMTKPIRQWYVGREFNRRMKKLFDARDIEIPFPHRTLYWGKPKRGEAPPMPLHIHNGEALAITLVQGERQIGTRHREESDIP